MGELLSVCCGRKTDDSQPRTYGGGGASDLYNIRDPAYVTDNPPCDGNDCDGGAGDGGEGGNGGGCSAGGCGG